jgi:osmotically-inducible protein OsmY
MFVIAPTNARQPAKVVDVTFRDDPLIPEMTPMNQHARLLSLAAVLGVLMLTGGCNKSPEPAAATPAPVQAAANIPDADITTNVKTALQQNDALKGFDITVITLKGDVRLIGVVNTQAQIDEVIRIARAAAGAHTIHDELTVKK